MNVINILKKYTQDRIIQEILESHSLDEIFSSEYIGILNQLLEADKSNNSKESKYIISFEFDFDDEDSEYLISAINKDTKEEANITSLSNEDIIYSEIDEEVYLLISEIRIIAEIIYSLFDRKVFRLELDPFSDENIFIKLKDTPFGELLKAIDDTEIETIPLGTINIDEEIIIASPLEHMINKKNNYNILDVKHGLWTAEIIKKEDNKNTELVFRHEEFKENNEIFSIFYEGKREGGDIEIITDNDMIVISKLSYFRNDNIFPEDYIPENNFGDIYNNKREKYYGKCCDTVISQQDEAGIIPGGVVSSTGGIDISTYLTYKNEQDEIVGIRVLFIDLF